MESHQIHPELLRHRVRILVVGCGGNASVIAAGLPYLHQALLVYGHPEGLHVMLLDPDAISLTNCVRQPFSRSEIGLYKSVVLANRLNLFWGLDWEGIPERLDGKRKLTGVDIVIGCVDTRAARAAIAKCVEDWSEVDYWLDLGNNADSGQFVLGEPLNRRNRRVRSFACGLSQSCSRKSSRRTRQRRSTELQRGRSTRTARTVRQSHLSQSRACAARPVVSIRHDQLSRSIRNAYPPLVQCRRYVSIRRTGGICAGSGI